MNSKSKYKTRQRDILISYLKTRPGEHVTANELSDYFRQQGNSIGQATVYRHLEGLVDEGVVTKYVIDGNSPACFEYVGEDGHVEGEVCFHCKCEKCGRLIHMHCEELEGIGQHLSEHHDFLLNPMRTVFYGICGECRSKGDSGSRSGA